MPSNPIDDSAQEAKTALPAPSLAEEVKNQQPLLVRSQVLIEIEEILMNYFRALEGNKEGLSAILLKLKSLISNQPAEPLDRANELLIHFYKQIIRLVVASQDKSNQSNIDIHVARRGANVSLSDLCINNPLLWNSLLYTQAGRYSCHYLIFIDICHPDPSDFVDVAWQKAFLKDRSCPQESDVLEYFDKLINDEIEEINFEEIDPEAYVKNIKNPFEKARVIFLIFSKNKITIEQLLQWLNFELPINGNIPRFIAHYIQLHYAQLITGSFVPYIADANNADKFFMMIEKLVGNQFLPRQLLLSKEEPVSSINRVLLAPYFLYQHGRAIEIDYSVSNKFSVNTLKDRSDQCLFASIVCLSLFSGLEKLGTHILHNMILGAKYLIKKEFPISETRQHHYFWKIIPSLFCRLELAEYQAGMRNTIEILFKRNHFSEALILLNNVVAEPDFTSYQALSKIIILINKLPVENIGSCNSPIEVKKIQEDFISLLTEINENKHNVDHLTAEFLFHLNSVHNTLKATLARSVIPLKSLISFFEAKKENSVLLAGFRRYIVKIANILSLDSNDIEKILFDNVDKNGPIFLKKQLPFLEEKKSVPSLELEFPVAATENNFLSHLDILAKNMKMMISEIPTYKRLTLNLKSAPSDEILVCNIYSNLELLFALSKKTKETLEPHPAFDTAKSEIYRQLFDLQKKNSISWNRMLSAMAGRHVIYFVALTRALLTEADLESTRYLLKALSSTSHQDDDEPGIVKETDVLEYQELLLDYFFSNSEIKGTSKNCLANDHTLLDSNAPEKISSTPLKLSKHSPSFVLPYIQIIFTSMFLRNITNSSFDTAKCMSVINKLVSSRHFPANMVGMKGEKLAHVVYKIYQLCQCIEVYASQYLLADFNTSNILQYILISHRVQAISLFSTLQHLECITPDVVKDFSKSVLDITEYDLLGRYKIERKNFHLSVIKMLSLLNTAEFYDELKKIIIALIVNEKDEDIELFLSHFSNFPSHRHKKQFISLLSAVQFISDLSKLNASPAILNSIKDKEYDVSDLKFDFLTMIDPAYVLKSRLELIIGSLRKKNKCFKESDKAFFKFKQSIVDFAMALGFDKQKLSEIQEEICYDPEHAYFEIQQDILFESEKEEKSNSNPKVKNKKKNRVKNKLSNKTQANERNEVEDKASEKAVEKAVEKAPEKALEKTVEKAPEKAPDKVENQSKNKVITKQASKAVDKDKEKPTATVKETNTDHPEGVIDVANKKTKNKSTKKNPDDLTIAIREVVREEVNKIVQQEVKKVVEKEIKKAIPEITNQTANALEKKISGDVNTRVNDAVSNILLHSSTETTTLSKSTPLPTAGMSAPKQTIATSPISATSTEKKIPVFAGAAPIILSSTTPTSQSMVPVVLRPSMPANQAVIAPITPRSSVLTCPPAVASPTITIDSKACLSSAISSHGLFKPNDVMIAREQVPSILLGFAYDFKNLTGKDLFVTGGAILYFMRNQENPFDVDCIAFEKIDRIRLLLIPRYDCRVIGKKHQIINLILTQECNLVFMPSPPDKSELKKLAINSDAAYVYTPTGIFYVNKKSDECIPIPLSKEQFEFFKKEMISPEKKNKLLTDEDLKKIKLMTGHRHVRSIEIDLTCSEQALMQDLYARDFELAALAMQLTPGLAQFKVIGTESAINSVKQGWISVVNKQTIFNDLQQLYRLAKIRLKNPNKCFLLSVGTKELSTIDPAMLAKARCSNRSIVIRKNQNEFFVYGDKKGDGNWVFTKVTAESSHGLGALTFEERVVKCIDVQFDQIPIINAVKEGHANPMFFMDPELNAILKRRDFNIQFNDFIFSGNQPENITHLRQINTKIDNLLDSFADTESVMEMLCDLPIMQGMTGISDCKPLLETVSSLDQYIKTLPAGYRKTAFYLFIDIHVCFLRDKRNIKTATLIQNVAQTLEPINDAPQFNTQVKYLRENSLSRRLRPLSISSDKDQAFVKMITDVRYCYFLKQCALEVQIENAPMEQDMVTPTSASASFRSH